MNRKIINGTLAIYILLFVACTSTRSGTKLSLMEAIEQTAEKIAGELPKGSRVAIVAFESSNTNLSDYIMEELTGALFDRGIEVADRQNLEYVYKELHFQMSGDISDESVKSIGKFLGADMVIIGQLLNISGTYRYRTSAISVENAVRTSVTRLNVQNDAATRRMVTTITKQKTTTKVAKYADNENRKPQTVGTLLDRGILFASRGDYQMAIEEFTQAIKLDPNMSTAYILRGRALLASVAKVVKAEANFSGIIMFTSISGSVSSENVQVYDSAIADFTRAIQLNPNNAIAYHGRGVATMEGKSDNDRAIADFTQAIRLDPNNAMHYHSRGLAYYNKKYYDRAIADYNQAIRLDTNLVITYCNRGNTYIDKQEYDQAIADCNKAIRLEPNNAIAYIIRGLAYYYKHNYNQAIVDFTKAIQLDPNNSSAYSSRGYVYIDKQNYDQAITDYTQAIRLDPNKAMLYFNRGNAYYYKQNYNQAIADFTQAIRLDSNNAMAYNNRGNVYYDNKNYNQAISDYTQAIQLDPNTTGYKKNLENARRKRGQ